MFKRLLILGLFAVAALPVLAQDYPKFELGGDFSYVRANTTFKNQCSGCTIEGITIPVGSTSQSADLLGGKGEIAYNFNHIVGMVADFGGYDVTGLPKGTGAAATLFTYMFGPRFTYRGSERFQPFGEFLVGGSHISASVSSSGTGIAGVPYYFGTSGNSFALALGGGFDVKVAQHVAIRLFEGDWFMTRFNSTLNSAGRPTAGTQNNFRLAAGIQFRF